MAISERVVARSTEAARARAETEVTTLLEAGLAALTDHGSAGLTVAYVLQRAGLSTRAFYRHFASKDELVLAVFTAELERSLARRQAAVDAAPDATAAVVAWIDETLALGYARRRAPRTRTLFAEGARLRPDHPDQFAETVAALLAPLVDALRAGRRTGELPTADPELDAVSIHAVTRELVERRLAGDTRLSLPQARAHVIRFCLPALGARP